MRISNPKKISAAAERPSTIRPWRDAILAGVAVAAAISLGAAVVYEKARTEKMADVRQHLVEMARRMAQLNRGQALDSAAIENLAESIRIVRDNTADARRIYTFKIEQGSQTSLDTGSYREKPGSRPLPMHALRAREHFRPTKRDDSVPAWSVADGLEATAFALMAEKDRQAQDVLAIEVDTEQVMVGLSAIRQALWFTCGLGILAGIISGFVVWHLRTRASLVQALLNENRRVEDAIIASLGEIVYTYNPAAARFKWRGNVRTLLGFSPPDEGVSREEWLQRVHPDDRERYAAALGAASGDGGQPMNLEYRVQGAEETVWMLDRGQPVRLDDGRPQLAGSLTDLTSRRHAEEALRIFFEGTANAHLALDGDMIVDANPAAVTLFAAADRRALLAEPGWALWPQRQPTQALSAEAWAGFVTSAITAGSIRFEWQFQRLDGTHVDCDVFLRPTTFLDREVMMMGCSDISPTKRAQARLIESEQRFRDVSSAIGEFVWEVDREGRYTYASERVRDVLGVEPAEVLGRHPFDFVPDEDLEAVKARSNAILKVGEPFRNFEHRVCQTDGTCLWISVSGVPCYDASGAITGYRGASLDITKHRAYEQQLLLQKDAAEAAGRAKGSFLAMMSHEIRTPLNSVLGFADLVLDTPLSPTQRDYLQTIKSSGDALLGLLNDILDFSKIESGQMAVEIRPTAVDACIREALDLYRPRAEARGLDLSFEITPQVPPSLLTDPSRLRQILLNLVGNAVKFTAAGRVQVTAKMLPAGDDQPERVRILIADTGIGITSEQRKRLFTPFTQADSSTTRRFGGTGLGLAISRRLAELLGGELGLVEDDEPGARFFVDLPIHLPDRTVPDEPGTNFNLEAARERLARRTPLVLVVDDNTLNRRLTSKLLHQLGAQTDTAASAAECYEKVAAKTYDFVLMDVQMPGTDGLQATRELRAFEAQWNVRRHVVVALTADAMVGDRERCLEAGMDDYLTKPLLRDELIRILDAHDRERGA